MSGFGRTLSHDVTLAGDAVTGQTNVYIGPFVVPVALNGRKRSGRKEDGAHSGSGPQRLLAPMPGKLVRVLVKKGDAVLARQAIAVIKKRTGIHERTIRELRFENGLAVGNVVREFEGVLTGFPRYVGDARALSPTGHERSASD